MNNRLDMKPCSTPRASGYCPEMFWYLLTSYPWIVVPWLVTAGSLVVALSVILYLANRRDP